MDTFESQEREDTVQNKPHTLLHHWLPREIFFQALNVSMAGPGSIITWPWWLAFFYSELCSMCCGDEFG